MLVIGHYSASFAAKAAKPAAPLWVYVAATMWLDIAWCVFIMLGLEQVVANPAVTEGVSFTYQPYSHSLLAALVWSVLAWALSRALYVDKRAALLIGLVVLSHWFLDLLVHHPDLPLWPNGPKVGFGLWDWAGVELGLEILLFLIGGALVLALFRREGKRIWPLSLFLAFGVLFLIGTSSVEPPTTIDPAAVGGASLVAYMIFIALTWLIERGSRRRTIRI